MMNFKLTLINKLGLHARASAKLVALAARFHSQIELTKENQTVNGKSIMGVMMLGAPLGSELSVMIDGEDEVEMADALTALINNRFGETE
jgi:phosphocarrier protein HPr